MKSGIVKNAASEIILSLGREAGSALPRARDAIIFLTYSCTGMCKTCNIWRWEKQRENELSWDMWKAALGRMKDYGVKSIEIFGGDALLRKDVVFNMIRFCRDNGITSYFPTNSILLDRATVSELIDSGLDTLYFSLDDVGEDFDKIKGVEGAFDKVKTALANMAELKNGRSSPKIIVCSTISKMNWRNFGRLVEFLSEYKVDAVYPRVLGEFTSGAVDDSGFDGIKPEPFFVSTDETSHRLSESEHMSFISEAGLLAKSNKGIYINLRAYTDTGFALAVRGKTEIKKCLMCASVMIVSPSGDVSPCLAYKGLNLGNILQKDISEIWGSGAHRKFIASQKAKSLKICSECVSTVYYPGLKDTILYFARRFLKTR